MPRRLPIPTQVSSPLSSVSKANKITEHYRAALDQQIRSLRRPRRPQPQRMPRSDQFFQSGSYAAVVGLTAAPGGGCPNIGSRPETVDLPDSGNVVVTFLADGNSCLAHTGRPSWEGVHAPASLERAAERATSLVRPHGPHVPQGL
jgi:hypothetical protein